MTNATNSTRRTSLHQRSDSSHPTAQITTHALWGARRQLVQVGTHPARLCPHLQIGAGDLLPPRRHRLAQHRS